MTKEEFMSQHKELKEQKSAINDKINELQDNYIKYGKRRYEVGQKVKITRPTGQSVRGIITDYRINMHNDIVPIVAQIRKDGKPHVQKTWGVYQGDKIEVID